MLEVDLEKIENILIKIHWGNICKAQTELAKFNLGEVSNLLHETEMELSILHNSIRAFIQQRDTLKKEAAK